MTQTEYPGNTCKGIAYDAQGYQTERGVAVTWYDATDMTCDIVTIGSRSFRADELSVETRDGSQVIVHPYGWSVSV